MATGTAVSADLNCSSPIHTTDWERAPLLRGTTRFMPLENVRNIVVTGGAGFMLGFPMMPPYWRELTTVSGSWVVRHLVLSYAESYNVICFDKLDYCSSLNNIRMLESIPNFKFIHGDVASSEDVMGCFKTCNADTVIHFAAQSHVDQSFTNPYAFIRDNVYGTNVLLECAKNTGISRFIHVSTDEVYGEVPHGAENSNEDSLLAPTNPYSASKAAAEMMVMAYSKSFQLPIITVRLNNVYGPHQYPEKIIPKFISLLQRGQKLMIHGDGSNLRRHLWAGDAADAFDTVLHRGVVGHIYNVGSQDEISNLDLGIKLLNMFGLADTKNWIGFIKDRPFHDSRYALDDSKLQTLGWKQQVSFEEGLQRTIEWYRDFPLWWGNLGHVLTGLSHTGGQAMMASGYTKHKENKGPFVEDFRIDENVRKRPTISASRMMKDDQEIASEAEDR